MALSGLLCALSFLFLFAANLIPLSTFFGPAFASLCFVPLLYEFGIKRTLLAYAAVALLAFFFVQNREIGFLFIFFTGYYPVLHYWFAKIQNNFLRIFCKLLWFIVAAVLQFLLLFFVLGTPLQWGNIPFSQFTFLSVGGITAVIIFILYDILLEKVGFLYMHYFRNKFFS